MNKNELFEPARGAEFSECGKYRYNLWRIWNPDLPIVMCIGLNPSTANADTDDQTINNLSRILTTLGYGGFYMMNCWPYITSKPKFLKTDIGSDRINKARMLETVRKWNVAEVIFAWGNFKIVKEAERDKELEEMFPGAKCFGFNQNGTPKHPLALMYEGTVNNPELYYYTSKDIYHEKK